MHIVPPLERQAADRTAEPYLWRAAPETRDRKRHPVIIYIGDELPHAINQVIKRLDFMQRVFDLFAKQITAARCHDGWNSRARPNLAGPKLDRSVVPINGRIADRHYLVGKPHQIQSTHL
ncbi:MAG TPA: hypothetical protein VGG11_19170, partial [Xanthobacteraceae bacterium]